MDNPQQNSTQEGFQQQAAPMQQTIIVNAEKNSNGMGVAGFVLALLALIFSWVPVLDFIIWFLGALFSLIGVFKKPKGFAIAGLIISFIGIIVIVGIIGVIGMAL